MANNILLGCPSPWLQSRCFLANNRLFLKVPKALSKELSAEDRIWEPLLGMAQYNSSAGRAGGAKMTDFTQEKQNALTLYQRSSKWVSVIWFGVLKVMGEALKRVLESYKYLQHAGVIFNPDSAFTVHSCWSLLENPSLCNSPEEAVPIPSGFCESSPWKSAWNSISQLSSTESTHPHSHTYFPAMPHCLLDIRLLLLS